GLDKHVHRAFRVRAGNLAADAGDDLLRARELEVEQAQRAWRVQAVDEMLDVFGGILLAHQTRYRVLELAAVDDHRRRVGEAVVLTGVVDVQVRVQNPAHVLRRKAEVGELRLEHLLFRDPALHAEPVHDLRALRAGVDHDRVLAAEDQEAERRRFDANSHVAGQHQEARVELDVDEVQEFDLERHLFTLHPRSVDVSGAVLPPLRADVNDAGKSGPACAPPGRQPRDRRYGVRSARTSSPPRCSATFPDVPVVYDVVGVWKGEEPPGSDGGRIHSFGARYTRADAEAVLGDQEERYSQTAWE